MGYNFDPRALWTAAESAARTIGDAFVEGWASAAAPPGRTATPASASEPASHPRSEDPPVRGPSRDADLGAKLDRLLSRALAQSTMSGQDELFHRILDQIVPDEARMISALSDGSSSPLVSVHALTRAGLLGEALIENASLVGRTANVALPAMTPTYVGHLLALGLVEVGPEDPDLKDEYQILLADSDVLKAIRNGSRGPLPARVERRTVRLSPLGKSLWHAAMGDEA